VNAGLADLESSGDFAPCPTSDAIIVLNQGDRTKIAVKLRRAAVF
jgi:hypothetical protein